MNILVTYRELDIPVYDMLGKLSERMDMNIYIAITSEEQKKNIAGNCIPLYIPPIRSKFVLKTIKALRKIIKEKSIDIIFSPSSAGLSNGLFATLGTKVKNITYRGTDARVKRIDITYYLGILNPRVSHVICNTENIKKTLLPYFKPEQLIVNPKPFDIKWIEDALRHPKTIENIPDDAFRVLTIANTKGRPSKGLPYLIDAIHLIDHPKLHFTLLGDYDECDYKRAHEGPAKERMHFLGERRDHFYFIPGNDLYVHPSSLRDAFPRALKEAMAFGLPCVVTDIPGPTDIAIENVTTLVVPPANSEKLAEAIVELMEDEERRKKFGEAGRERIIKDFSTENYIDCFEHFFRSLV